MRLRRAEVVEHAHDVVGVVGEREGTFIVVAVAVAARVPGDGVEERREGRHLVRPVAPVAADAVQEDDEIALAGVLDGDMRRGADLDDGGRGHAGLSWLTE